MTRRCERLRMTAWMAFLVSVILVASAAGEARATSPLQDPGVWALPLERQGPAPFLVACVRLAVLGASWYLLGLTVLDVVVHLRPRQSLRRLQAAVTIPVLGGLVRGAAGLSLATSTLLPTAMAAPAGAAPALTEPTVGPGASGSAAGAPPTLRRLPDVESAPRSIAPAEWTVAPGDHLWSIAERALAASWGRSPVDGETARYWLALIDANRDRLADPSNPDLLFAGQRLRVPPPPAAG